MYYMMFLLHLQSAKVFWFDKQCASDGLGKWSGVKSISMSATCVQMLLKSFCMPCAKIWGAFEKERRLRKNNIEIKSKLIKIAE